MLRRTTNFRKSAFKPFKTSSVPNLPIGSSDFYDIRKNFFYVDKTSLIEEILERDDQKVKLITRPRRFGKSLALSMLKYFFDDSGDKQSSKLFAGLEIENYSKVQKHQRKYTVIHLDLKDLKNKTYKAFLEEFKEIMSNLYKEFEKKLKNLKETLSKSEKDEFSKIIKKESDAPALKNSLLKLCQYVCTYNKEHKSGTSEIEPIILIDEFDTPLSHAHLYSFFDAALDVLEPFLSSVLKNKDNNFKVAIITGIIRVSGSGLFSKWNNVTFSSLNEDQYANGFGFTETEVKEQLSKRGHDVEKEYPKLLKYYGHYYCGNQMLFNSWSIANAIKDKKINYDSHWIKNQKDEIIDNAINKISKGVLNQLKILMNNGHVETIIDEHISYSKPAKMEESIWFFSLLYFTGYLAGIPFTKDEKDTLDRFKVRLIIPNHELFTYYVIQLKIRDKSFDEKKYKFEDRNQLIKKISANFYNKAKIEEVLNVYKENDRILGLFCYCSLLFHDAIPLDILIGFTNSSTVSEFINEVEKRYLIERDIRYNNIAFDDNVHQHIFEYFKNSRDHQSLIKNCIRSIINYLSVNFIFDGINNLDSSSITKLRSLYPHTTRIIDIAVKEKYPIAIESLLLCLMQYELDINMNGSAVKKLFELLMNILPSPKTSKDWLLNAKACSIKGKAHRRLNEFNLAQQAFNRAGSIFKKLIGSFINRSHDLVLLQTIKRSQAINYANWAKLHESKAEYDSALNAYKKIDELYQEDNFEKYFFQTEKHLLEITASKLNPDLETKQIIDNTFERLKKALSNKTSIKSIDDTLIAAWAKINLARIYRNFETEDLNKEASRYLNEAEASIKKILGENHYEIAKIFVIQLNLFQCYPDYDARYLKALEIFDKYFPNKTNLVYARAHLFCGSIYDEVGYPAQALKRYKAAQDVYENIFKENKSHPTLAIIYNYVGEAFRITGDINSAFMAYEESHKISAAIFGNDSVNAAIELNNLAEIDLMRCELKVAEEKFKHAYELVKHHFGSSHIRTLTIYCNIVKCQFLQGQYTHLYPSPDHILQNVERTKQEGYDGKLVADVLYEFGQMYLSIGNIFQAKNFFDEAAASLNADNKKQPKHAIYESELMVVYAMLGEFRKSITMLMDAKQIFEDFSWQNYPIYQRFKLNVARITYLMSTNPNYQKFNQEKYEEIKKLMGIDDPLSLIVEAKDAYKKHNHFIRDYIEALILLGKFFYIREKLLEALEAFNTAKVLLESKLKTQHHKHAEINFYLARIYQKQNDSTQLEEAYQAYLKNGQCLYSNLVIELTRYLKKIGLLGYIEIEKLYEMIRKTEKGKKILSSSEKIKPIVNHYLRLLQEAEDLSGKKNILITLFVITYLLGDYTEASSYLERYKQAFTDKKVFLHILPLAAYIPTRIEPLVTEMQEVIANLSENDEKQCLRKAILYHNIGCLFQVLAYHQNCLLGSHQWSESANSSEGYFKESIRLGELTATKCEYINFLYNRGHIDKIINLFLHDKSFSIESLSYDLQSYSQVEKPVLVKALQRVIECEEIIKVDQKALAFYLLSLCFISKDQDNFDDYTFVEHLKLFKQYVDSRVEFYNPDRSTSVSCYLLADAYFKYEQTDEALEYIEKAVNSYNAVYPNKDCKYANEMKNEIKRTLKRTTSSPSSPHPSLSSSSSPSPSPSLSSSPSTSPSLVSSFSEAPKVPARRNSSESALFTGIRKKSSFFSRLLIDANISPPISPSTPTLRNKHAEPSKIEEQSKKLYAVLKTILSKTLLLRFTWNVINNTEEKEKRIFISTNTFDELCVVIRSELFIELRDILYKMFSKDFPNIEIYIRENTLDIKTKESRTNQLIYEILQNSLQDLAKEQKDSQEIDKNTLSL